jgi:hypothetical protein
MQSGCYERTSFGRFKGSWLPTSLISLVIQKILSRNVYS